MAKIPLSHSKLDTVKRHKEIYIKTTNGIKLVKDGYVKTGSTQTPELASFYETGLTGSFSMTITVQLPDQ